MRACVRVLDLRRKSDRPVCLRIREASVWVAA